MTTKPASRLAHGLRWLLGGLLLWAAISKLANPTAFLGSIYAYELPLPRLWQQMAAVLLPWLELLCGLLLLAGFWRESTLLTVTALMALFVVATGQAWARGLDIACGCFNLKIFGLDERLPGLVRFLESVTFAFFRNLLLTAMSGYLLWRALRAPAADAAIPGE